MLPVKDDRQEGSTAENRALTQFVADAALDVLAVFEAAHPGDPRPRRAIDAARQFLAGDRPSRLQRLAAIDAYQAATESVTQAGRLAAQAAGDAAAAALRAPTGDDRRTGLVLRAAANCALIAELEAGDRGAAAAGSLRRTVSRASPVVVDVVRRSTPPERHEGRQGELLAELDAALRRRP